MKEQGEISRGGMSMYTAECDILGLTPFGFSKAVSSQRKTNERHDDYEERTWREKIHTDAEGNAFINPMALKNCLSDCARFLSENVPGKGKATYTKHFDAGVMVSVPLMLGVKSANVVAERLFVPSDGKKGGGKRVWKNFPKVDPWKTHATITVIDATIKPEKLQEYLNAAGQFIGLGYFRPRNGGFWGKFKIENFKIVRQS